jgi:hypothetical protein
MPRQCLTSAHNCFISLNLQLTTYYRQIWRRCVLPDTNSAIKHTTNKLTDTQWHTQRLSNSYPTNSARLRHYSYSLNLLPLPQTHEELQGHFFVVGLKETKGNVQVTKSHSQYTGFTSHINIAHRYSTQLHILHIFTNIVLFCTICFISRQDQTSKTVTLHCDAHLLKFNRINSLASSSIVGRATSAGTRRGEGSVTL